MRYEGWGHFYNTFIIGVLEGEQRETNGDFFQREWLRIFHKWEKQFTNSRSQTNLNTYTYTYMNSYVNRNIYDKYIKLNKKFLPRYNIGKLHPGMGVEEGLSSKE